MRVFSIHFDGSCGPKNPGGTAAYGVILAKAGVGVKTNLVEEAGVIGTGPLMSNNLAEFHALGVGLQRYLDHGPLAGDELIVFGDSNIVIQIMGGKWKASKDKLYYPAYFATWCLLEDITELGVKTSFHWIPREENTECDDLSKAHEKKDR